MNTLDKKNIAIENLYDTFGAIGPRSDPKR